MDGAATPVLVLGAGSMGGALIAGWRRAGALDAADLFIRDPAPGAEALASGARLNPGDAALSAARTLVVAVKPQVWRAAVAAVEPHLARDAVVVSVAAGVRCADLARALGGRAVARVMPTTAAAIGRGTAGVFAADAGARARAHALFEPLGAVVDLDDEDLLHAATAVCGSAPAYLYAFVEALEAAGAAAGLPAETANRLARSTMAGAAALMAESGEGPGELRRKVASPGGTTEAALRVLTGPHGLPELLHQAVAAAARRSRELGG